MDSYTKELWSPSICNSMDLILFLREQGKESIQLGMPGILSAFSTPDSVLFSCFPSRSPPMPQNVLLFFSGASLMLTSRGKLSAFSRFVLSSPFFHATSGYLYGKTAMLRCFRPNLLSINSFRNRIQITLLQTMLEVIDCLVLIPRRQPRALPGSLPSAKSRLYRLWMFGHTELSTLPFSYRVLLKAVFGYSTRR